MNVNSREAPLISRHHSLGPMMGTRILHPVATIRLLPAMVTLLISSDREAIDELKYTLLEILRVVDGKSLIDPATKILGLPTDESSRDRKWPKDVSGIGQNRMTRPNPSPCLFVDVSTCRSPGKALICFRHPTLSMTYDGNHSTSSFNLRLSKPSSRERFLSHNFRRSLHCEMVKKTNVMYCGKIVRRIQTQTKSTTDQSGKQ